MKTDSGVIKYSSKQDYIQNRGNKKIIETSKKAVKKVAEGVTEKVDISKNAENKIKNESKKVKDKIKQNFKENKGEIKAASKHLLSDALSVASNIVKPPVPGISSIPNPLNLFSSDSKEVEVPSVMKSEQTSLKRPGVFFVSGLHLAGISSDEKGLPEMASQIPGGEHFSWKDENKIMQEILRRPAEQPVILVGHSLGGDAVVNIANRLNTLENGFRKVNLLVTLDSVGFDNDIIPQNVDKNLNFISDKDTFFNDGPNIARNSLLTEVKNELHKASHTEIDEANDVQFQIMQGVKDVLGSKRVDDLIEMMRVHKLNKNSRIL